MPLERISALVLNEDIITQSRGKSAVHTQSIKKIYFRPQSIFPPGLKPLKGVSNMLAP
jgi:hypothetical protein